MGVVPLPQAFIEAVRPGLAAGDATRVAEAVRAQWKPADLCTMLRDPDCEVRQTTAVVLGLVGDRRTVACLARALHDKNPRVNEMAEHALWSIWFRLVPAAASKAFHRGLSQMTRDEPAEAIQSFRRAIDADRDYSEAWNQCAMAHFSLDQNAAAVRCCEQTLELMPCHFGAAAGMGHAYAAMGRWRLALASYRRALRINPRMEQVASAKRRLAERLETREDPRDASGTYQSLHFA